MTRPRVKKMAELTDLIEETDRLLLPGGDIDLAEQRVEVALKLLSSSHSKPDVARVYIQAAQIKVELGKYKETETYGLQALDLLRDTAEHKLRGKSQWCLGRAHFYLGEIDKSRMFFEDSLSTCRTIGDKQGKLDAVNGLTLIDFTLSDWPSAKKRLSYGYRINQESTDQRGMALCLTNLATVSILLGEHDAAEEALKESIQIKEELGDVLLLTHSWISLSRLYLRERRWSEASRLIQKAKKVSQEHNFPRELALSLESEGELYYGRGEHIKSEKSYLNGLKIEMGIAPNSDIVSQVLRKLADLYVAIKEPDKAIEYGRRALEISAQLGDRFEQGCCHRALAMAFGLKGLKDETQEAFAKSISVFRGIGERFELANTLLVEGEFSRRADLLREAHRLFTQIQNADYYVGLARLQMARAEPSPKSASGHLREAEDMFRARDETERLKEVAAFKAELNQRLSSSQARRYQVLQGISSDDLGQNLERLIKEVEADRGFLAYARDSRGKMGIEARHNLTEEETRRLLSLLTEGDCFEVGKPSILYDTALDDRFSPTGAYSLMVTPFGNGDRVDGYLYVDRQGNREPFLDKEFDLFFFLSERVAKAIAEKRQEELEKKVASLQRQLKLSGEIVTQDSRILDILDEVERIKDAGYPVLIEGETGTGKELIARLIHSSGCRKGKPFKAVNCSSIPDNLLESELFGHERGAFTDAKTLHRGIFEVADGGTVFLDEIAELSLILQPKILRVLEGQTFRRVGGTEEIKVDVRVIVATNKDLAQATQEGSFRDDLYYRIEGATLWLPPLRKRKDDIPFLCDHFMELYGERYGKKVRGIAPQALELLMEFSWPGNIRQLSRAIEVAVSHIQGEEGEITEDLLSMGKKKGAPEKTRSEATSLKQKVEQLERETIIVELARQKWNKSRTARALALTRRGLENKIKRYNLVKAHL